MWLVVAGMHEPRKVGCVSYSPDAGYAAGSASSKAAAGQQCSHTPAIKRLAGSFEQGYKAS
jgi:hypothetical protein